MEAWLNLKRDTSHAMRDHARVTYFTCNFLTLLIFVNVERIESISPEYNM